MFNQLLRGINVKQPITDYKEEARSYLANSSLRRFSFQEKIAQQQPQRIFNVNRFSGIFSQNSRTYLKLH